MSSIKITLLALCTVSFVAACGQKADEVVYVDEPSAVTTEPTYTGKYK